MSQLTATFDGPRIKIEGVETVTHHQLFVASRWLENRTLDISRMDGEKTVTIEFEARDLYFPLVCATRDLADWHYTALAGELLFIAQVVFNGPQISAIVRTSVQAMAREMAAQQHMARLQSKIILPGH